MTADCRLSPRDRAILAQLDRGEAYGFDLVDAGVASRGSVYVVLARLEDRGLVARYVEVLDDKDIAVGHLPRHRFSITERGRAALSANPSVPVARVSQSRWRQLLHWLKTGLS